MNNYDNLETTLLDQLAEIRKSAGKTQKDLEKASGVKQPMIARIENGGADPQLSTVIKLLEPLGKTLAVVSIKKRG